MSDIVFVFLVELVFLKVTERSSPERNGLVDRQSQHLVIRKFSLYLKSFAATPYLEEETILQSTKMFQVFVSAQTLVQVTHACREMSTCKIIYHLRGELLAISRGGRRRPLRGHSRKEALG